MDAVQQILDREAIRDLKAKYFRCFDTKDWEDWLSVFTEDVELEFSLNVVGNRPDPDATKLVGKQALRDFVPPHTQTAQTVHQGHTPEIELISETEAREIWAMEDIVDYGPAVYHGFGHYHETYRKVDGAWRISSVRLSRLRISRHSRDQLTLFGT